MDDRLVGRSGDDDETSPEATFPESTLLKELCRWRPWIDCLSLVFAGLGDKFGEDGNDPTLAEEPLRVRSGIITWREEIDNLRSLISSSRYREDVEMFSA